MSIFQETYRATEADEPARQHFREQGRRRKPPLNIARKRNPDRAEKNQETTPHSDLSQRPTGRDQQSEKFDAPVKRKSAHEIENEKAEELRSEYCRVVGHWHIHQQRRAAGAEARILDWKS